MIQFDWESFGAVLLERERRPVVVLDPSGRVVRTKRAMLLFLEDATRVHQVSFADEWLSPAQRPAFDEAWARALKGERGRVSLTLLPSAFHLEPVFELLPMSQGGQVRSVMLVIVDAVATSTGVPLAPATGVLYEVAIDEASRPRQLLRAASAERARIEPGPCHRVLHGRDAPCADCPLTALAKATEASTVRLVSASPFRAELITARRLSDELVTVNLVPLNEQLYSGLIQARVNALSERARLSPRERNVLGLLLMGRTLDDVAVAEGISARTAKFHQQNLLRKLGADSRTDLFRLLS